MFGSGRVLVLGERTTRATRTTRWMSTLSHVGKDGRACMVDVGGKAPSVRTAVAAGKVLLGQQVFQLVNDVEHGRGGMRKGSVLATAQLAGIMGAKRTADLIPLCHPVSLTHVGIDFELNHEDNSAQTGVEMEALSAVTIAALTIYDMCKAAGKDIVITDVKLLRKTGGKSGEYNRGDYLPS